jgi:YbbR domain-containing protein
MSVTVHGPASQVNLVSAADAPIYLRGANSQVERFETVRLVDDLNQRVAQVEASPDIVEVVVPVERWPGRKEVAVRVSLEGQPASGFRLGQIKVEPSVVVLRGNSDALSTIGFVETQPLSIEGATNDLRRRLQLILPSDVTAFEGNMVDVLVGVVPVEDSDRITIKPTPRNLGPGLKATIALDTVDVIVIGPQNILEGIGPDDIFVFLDLNGLLAGTHVIRPNVVRPPGVRLESVLPATVEVTIITVPTPTMPPAPVSPLSTPEANRLEP